MKNIRILFLFNLFFYKIIAQSSVINGSVKYYYDNGKTPERYQRQEGIRQQFRSFCESLGIKFNLDSLKEYSIDSKNITGKESQFL